MKYRNIVMPVQKSICFHHVIELFFLINNDQCFHLKQEKRQLLHSIKACKLVFYLIRLLIRQQMTSIQYESKSNSRLFILFSMLQEKEVHSLAFVGINHIMLFCSCTAMHTHIFHHEHFIFVEKCNQMHRWKKMKIQ